jgi:hypothetical protein
VPRLQIDVITPSHEKRTVVTNETGEATYTADEVGVYSYKISNPISRERVTNIFERTVEKTPEQPSTPPANATGSQTAPSIAQVILAQAPLCIGGIVLILLLSVALLWRRRRKKEKENRG